MAAKKTPVAEVATAATEVVSIKGFAQDMTCRGYQFAPGKTFTHEGRVEQCGSGFHACPVEHHPFSVFEYYPPAGSRFFEVRQSGKQSNGGTKLASAVITIDIELTIGDLVKRAWDYVWSGAIKTDDAHTEVDQGAASATGDQGAASATGDQGAAIATGTQGAASATGDQGAAIATGYQGAASATGDQGAAIATGYQGAASATGDQGAAISSYEGRVRGAVGNALFGIERDSNLDIISVAAGIVGRNDIEPDVWYVAKGGKLVQA